MLNVASCSDSTDACLRILELDDFSEFVRQELHVASKVGLKRSVVQQWYGNDTPDTRICNFSSGCKHVCIRII